MVHLGLPSSSEGKNKWPTLKKNMKKKATSLKNLCPQDMVAVICWLEFSLDSSSPITN